MFQYFLPHLPQGCNCPPSKLPDDQNDLPDLVQQWSNRGAKKKVDRSSQHFFVSVQEIRNSNYDLSVNRYREIAHETIEHMPPKQLIAELTEEEREIEQALKRLEEMVQ